MNAPLHFRLATLSDARQLAQVHYRCAKGQPGRFLGDLGCAFLHQFYRVILKETHSVVICAVNEENRVLGFLVHTLDAQKNRQAMRNARLRLFSGALLSLLRHPGSIWRVWSRYRSLSTRDSVGHYSVNSGPRGLHLAVLPEARARGTALKLQLRSLQVMRALGADTVRFEVDQQNEGTVRFHRALGAKIVQAIVTPDGNERLIMAYVLEKTDAPPSAVRIRSAGADDLKAIVRVHLSAFFSGFTLSMLGPTFLHKYYRQVLSFDEGILLVAEIEGQIVGFIAGSTNPRRFYQALSQHKWEFAVPALLAVLRRPHLMLRVGGLVRRSLFPLERLNAGSQASCELSNLSVCPERTGQGIGKALVSAFIDVAQEKKALNISLTTDAENNEDVNRFCQRLGFRLHRSFQASRKRLINEYVLVLPEKQSPATSANESDPDRDPKRPDIRPVHQEVYLAALRKSGARVLAGSGGVFWQGIEMRSMERRPEFYLDMPSADELNRVFWKAYSPLATYVCRVDAEHPQNAWLYLCDDQEYRLEKLSSPARRDIRRAIRELTFEFLDASTFLERGEKPFCDTRRRVGLSDGTPRAFRRTFQHFCENPAHHVIGAWAGDTLAAFMTVVTVDDWGDLYAFAANEHLRLCPNNGLIHFALDYFLAQHRIRVVNYGLSSIQEVSNAKSLHAFKKKVGFQCHPVHRAVVFHPFMRPLANRATLTALRAYRFLQPGNLPVRKAAGILATYLGAEPQPKDVSKDEADES
jgi:ribosomal protein S18 acetylase RimI-like enzyme